MINEQEFNNSRMTLSISVPRWLGFKMIDDAEASNGTLSDYIRQLYFDRKAAEAEINDFVEAMTKEE